MQKRGVAVMGSFVADLSFRMERLPRPGETLMGASFLLGPGGKGSNQAVAAARVGARVSFLSKLGRDAFGDIARTLFAEEGIDTQHLLGTETPTGAAAILIDAKTGQNSILVVPGACFELRPDEVDLMRDRIAASAVFLAQLELALPTVEHGLRLARQLGVTTVLNPAPACALPETIFADCDYLTPNETEAELLTGVKVEGPESAECAADVLLSRGVGHVAITLGAQGALLKDAGGCVHVPAFNAGPVVETTGAGDAFSGGLAAALSEGQSLLQAARFACAVAGLSVTRAGTARAMPTRATVEELLTGTR